MSTLPRFADDVAKWINSERPTILELAGDRGAQLLTCDILAFKGRGIRGAKCHEQLRYESSFATGVVVAWSA